MTYLLQIITDPHYFVVHCSLQLVMPSGEELPTQAIRVNLNSELTRLKESISGAVGIMGLSVNGVEVRRVLGSNDVPRASIESFRSENPYADGPNRCDPVRFVQSCVVSLHLSYRIELGASRAS